MGPRSRPVPLVLLACVALATVALVATLAGCGKVRSDYASVFFVDEEHGWVTGFDDRNKRTTLCRTVDGGATWQQVGTRASARGVIGWAAFATPAKGVWAVDIDKLLFTTTAGRPWRLAEVSGMRRGHFTAADFASAKVGWAAGVGVTGASDKELDYAGGAIAKTRDAGATWRVQKAIWGKRGDGGFIGVAAPSTRTCYALKAPPQGGVWATNDGGATWSRQKLPKVPSNAEQFTYGAVFFLDELTGWVVGGSLVAHTTDGGATWSLQNLGGAANAYDFYDICFTSADHGCLVGTDGGEIGLILVTQDGGLTWMRAPADDVSGSSRFNSVDFVSGEEGWVVEAAGWRPGDWEEAMLLHTIDGGLTWKEVEQ